MIEIIELGIKNRVRCDTCGALLSYQKDDVKEYYYDHVNFGGYERYIHCPQCLNKIVLKATR